VVGVRARTSDVGRICAVLLESGARGAPQSVERTRRGFVAHYADGAGNVEKVPGRLRREVESELRLAGVVIVDEWGAQIDSSQFEKESDPDFRKLRTDDAFFPSLVWTLLTPNWYLRWRHRRLMRQLSDDA
jgi:hypothetical protein